MSQKYINAKTKYDPDRKVWSGIKKEPDYNNFMSIAKAVIESFMEWPEYISQRNVIDDKSYENQDILYLSISCAEHFRKLGLERGDIFAMCGSNSDHAGPIFIGGMFAGLIATILDPNFDKDDITKILKETKPKIMFCDGTNFEIVRSALAECDIQIPLFTLNYHLREYDKTVVEFLTSVGNEGAFVNEGLLHGISQTAVIMYSKDGTNLPKGVCISHDSLLNTILPGIKPKDKVLCFDNLHKLSGLKTLITCLIQGATRIIVDQPFTPKLFFELFEKEKITILIMGPTELAMILSSDEAILAEFSSLKICLCIDRIFPFTLVEEMKKLKANMTLIYGYGFSEASGEISLAESERNGGFWRKICRKTSQETRSLGQLVYNCQVKILNQNGENLGPTEKGEICVKIPFKWGGYYGDVEATKNIYDEDGWIHSGDLGYFDERGNLFVFGRKKEIAE